jgi:glutamate synthase domain-containing protein 3
MRLAHDATSTRRSATRHRTLSRGHREILAPHNLGIALLQPLKLAGSAGYNCGGLNDGATIEIKGSAGWV